MCQAHQPHEVYTDYARTLIQVKARQLTHKPGFSRSDRADIEQELTLHLLSQAAHFDPARGSVNTFVDRVVTSSARMLMRRRGRLKRAPAPGVLLQSLEVMVEVPGEPPQPLWQTLMPEDLERRTGGKSVPSAAIEEDAEAVACAVRSLSPAQQDICRRLMTGNVTSVARDLGISRRSLRANLVTIREQFKRAGFEER
jgi:hypothetical protein